MSKFLSLKQKDEVVKSYNKLAMEQLQQENYDNSLSYLKQALLGIKGISEESLKNKLLAITYNNLGIFFKRMSNYPEALKYLYKSIELENKIPNEVSTISGAHLNVCSILSSQGDHSQAIRHGLRALFLLKSIYRYEPRVIPTLVTAYYNVAKEYTVLGQLPDAEDCYKIGLKICTEELGASHSLTSSFKQALGGYSRKMSPNYDTFRMTKNSVSPRGRAVNASAKVRSTSQEAEQKMNFSKFLKEKRFEDEQSKKSSDSRRAYPGYDLKKPFNIKRPGKSKSDEENSVTTDKSFLSYGSASRRIDLERHKATERVAAILIQSAWRGFKARKRYKELQMTYKLRQAEIKARKAVEEYEKLKQQATKLKKK
jgi:tetratricopeptide (TPR) repeat protein